MYYVMCASAPSLHRESTDSLIYVTDAYLFFSLLLYIHHLTMCRFSMQHIS